MSHTQTAPTSHNVAELSWIRLMRVYHQIDRNTAEIMKQFDLSVPRFDVLVHAGARDGRSQQELADAMFVTKGNVCQLLDGMEAENLLYRRRKGRTNHIFLTDAGRERRELALAAQLKAVDAAMARLTPEEQTTLNSLLRKLERSLAADTSWKGNQ